MANNKKKIYTVCALCQNRTIKIEVDKDLAENREYYPFEYLNVHGNPPHALMLFLDRNLSVRDKMVYSDLHIAKSQKKQFVNVGKMSLTETLGSIYQHPLRLKVLNILTKGPISEKDLIDTLSEDKKFDVKQFQILMLPFIKTGIIQTKWLKSYYQYYYLVEDFFAMRVPNPSVAQYLKNRTKFKSKYAEYIEKRDEVFEEYKKRFFSSRENQIQEIKKCFEIFTNPKNQRLIDFLIPAPKEKKLAVEFVGSIGLEMLKADGVIWSFKIKEKIYYTLLCDIKIKRFAPQYILGILTNKLRVQEITTDVVDTYLDLLYEKEEVNHTE